MKMDHNLQNDGSEIWDWQGIYNCLEDNLDISKCLWSSMNQNAEDVSYVLDDEITPVKACGDLTYYVTNCEDISKGAENCGEPSSQVKRRRTLQFNSEGLDVSLCNEETSSTYIRTKGRQEFVEEHFSKMSQCVSGYVGGTTASGYESCDQPSEAWVSSCFSVDDTHCSQIDMASDVQIDITELCESQCPPKFKGTINQEQAVRTQGKAFKGRKSYMHTPAKSASSVVYPFAFMKPCAVHGEATLKDINQRIHTLPPSKLKMSNDNPTYPTKALSGKPVLCKTKIKTGGGKGSITIMRTKG